MESLGMRRRAFNLASINGTRDGQGAADHDLPYRFGFRPTSRWTYPFTAREYCRLLILRGQVQDGDYTDDATA